jgi:hypothetical protein
MSGLDVDAVIVELKERKMPTEGQIKELCERATAILGEEDNVQCVEAPVTICGDLHGEPPPPPHRADASQALRMKCGAGHSQPSGGGAPAQPAQPCAAPERSLVADPTVRAGWSFRTILRPAGTVPRGWRQPQHELPVPGPFSRTPRTPPNALPARHSQRTMHGADTLAAVCRVTTWTADSTV